MHAFFPFVALLGLAAAQSETSNTASSTSSSAAADSTEACLSECAVADVSCKAVCVNVPAPNEAQILATNECSRNECTQGDSGPEDTKKYGECLASCASDFYYVSGGTPTGVATVNTAATAVSTPANSTAETTSSSGSAVSTGSSSRTGSSDSSEKSASSTASESAASAASSASGSSTATSTGAAAALTLSSEMLNLSGGVIGLIMAAFAL